MIYMYIRSDYIQKRNTYVPVRWGNIKTENPWTKTCLKTHKRTNNKKDQLKKNKRGEQYETHQKTGG